MARKKIALIGAGMIGGTLAHLAAKKEMGDIVLFDIAEGIPQGKALDLAQCGPIEGFDAKITGTNDYADIAGADVVHRHRRRAAQAGHEPRRSARHQPQGDEGGRRGHQGPRPRRVRHLHHQPARRDGLGAARIFRPSAPQGRRHGRRARQRALRHLPRLGVRGQRPGRQRLRARRPRRHDGPGDQLHDDQRHPGRRPGQDGQVDRRSGSTRSSSAPAAAAARSSALLKTGSAYYAPATSAIAMAEAYLGDQKRILPCAVYVDGKYGLDGLYVGVPAVLGAGGVEEVDRDRARRRGARPISRSASMRSASCSTRARRSTGASREHPRRPEHQGHHPGDDRRHRHVPHRAGARLRHADGRRA